MPEGRYQSVQSLVAEAASNPALVQQLKDDPVATLRSLAATPLATDAWIYRIVVIALGSAVLIALIAASILAGFSKTVPEGVIAIGSAAAGALAGLLAPSPARPT